MTHLIIANQVLLLSKFSKNTVKFIVIFPGFFRFSGQLSTDVEKREGVIK